MVKVCQEGQMWGLIVVAAGRIAVKMGFVTVCRVILRWLKVFLFLIKNKKYVM